MNFDAQVDEVKQAVGPEEGWDDPNVRVMRVEPSTAELWDGPSGSIVTLFKFAKAKLTGSKSNLGETQD
jgi:hypothetical protein